MMSSSSASWSAANSGTPAWMLSAAVPAAATWAVNGLLPARSRFRAADRASTSAGGVLAGVGWLGIVHHLARHEERQLRLRQVVEHPRPPAEPDTAGVVQPAERVVESADGQPRAAFLQMAPQHVELAADRFL